MFTKYEIVHDEELGYALRRCRFWFFYTYLDLYDYRKGDHLITWRQKDKPDFYRCWIRNREYYNSSVTYDEFIQTIRVAHRILSTRVLGDTVTDADFAMEKLRGE